MVKFAQYWKRYVDIPSVQNAHVWQRHDIISIQFQDNFTFNCFKEFIRKWPELYHLERTYDYYNTLLLIFNYIVTTVRLMSQCKRIFGDSFVTSRSIKLKLTSIIWRFRQQEIPLKTPIVKINRFGQRYDVAKSGRFLQWGGLWGFYLPVVGFEWNFASEFV